jgi:hypothetical protein
VLTRCCHYGQYYYYCCCFCLCYSALHLILPVLPVLVLPLLLLLFLLLLLLLLPHYYHCCCSAATTTTVATTANSNTNTLLLHGAPIDFCRWFDVCGVHASWFVCGYCVVFLVSLAGAGSCTLCPYGTFGNTTAVSVASCSGPCSAGYTCPVGSTSPAPGRYRTLLPVVASELHPLCCDFTSDYHAVCCACIQ